MPQLTYNQIVGAVAELPASDKQRLFSFLLAQPELSSENRNGAQAAAPNLTPLELPDPRPNDEWLQQHRDEYQGQWVALYDGKLIAHGNDSQALAQAVKASGAPIPLILFIEPSDTLPFAGF
ncbi:MAG: DUF5678 domain-containing protein [Acidobacteriota bacterium]